MPAGKIELHTFNIKLNLSELQNKFREIPKYSYQFQNDSPLVIGELISDFRDLEVSVDSPGKRWVLQGKLNGTAKNPDWSAFADLRFRVEGCFPPREFLWMDIRLPDIVNLEILPGSSFLIDQHKVELMHTLNALIRDHIRVINTLIQKRLRDIISAVSNRYLDSDYLTEQLNALKFQWNHQLSGECIEIEVSARKQDLQQEEKTDLPSYFLVEFPVPEFEFLISRINIPSLKIQNYRFEIISFVITGENTFSLEMFDRTENIRLLSNITLHIRNGIIYPEVNSLEIRGLNLLKATLFKVLWGMVIKRIESNPIDFATVSIEFQNKIKEEYPFISIQDGARFHLKELEFNQKKILLFLYSVQ